MSIPDDDDGGEFSELFDANIGRLDLVKTGANGMPFLIAKSAGVIDPDMVRDLIDSQIVEPVSKEKDDVTITGSPAAVMRMIHEAAQRPVTKTAESTADINDLPDSDFGYIEPGGTKDDSGRTVPRSLRHFPLTDAAHVRNALARAPQSPFGEKAMPKIRAAADKFGVTVAKAADDGDGMDADGVLADAAPDSARDVLDGAALDAPGDPDDPSSPAWEAVDAARARGMVAAITDLKASLALAAAREAQEAVSDSGDGDDADNAIDLDCASDALDYLLSVLAPFAACEQAEADGREAAAVSMLKAADVFNVIKAGRVLSAANLAAVQAAITALQEVLAAAQPAPQPEAAPVAKTTEETPMTETTPTDVVKAAEQLLVYDADGQVMGSVDPAKLTTFATPPAKSDDGSDSSDADADDAADEPADDEPPAAEPAAEPAADAATIPGTDTVQAPVEDQPVTKTELTADLLKAAFADALKEALGQQEDVVKTSLAALEGRLARVEALPAPGGPMLNGATGMAGVAHRDAPPEDGLAELRKAADAETDPTRKAGLQFELAKAAIAKAPTRPVGPVDYADILRRFTT